MSRKPQGLSCHVGLNSVDPAHYGGWSGRLNACEYDALDLEAIAAGLGYTTKRLLTAAATREAVCEEIRRAAGRLEPGDIFLLTYSGHGGQLPDRSGDERDLLDETWCLFDGQLVDDELAALWTRFADQVRIVVLSDSCHSGTVTRLMEAGIAVPVAYRAALSLGEGARQAVYRMMPIPTARETYLANRAFYDQILAATPSADEQETPQATVRLISACQDNQLAMDGVFNGLFTGTLMRVWDEGRFEGDYEQFHRAIVARMPPDQTPKHSVIGPAYPEFDAQKPFTI